MENTGTKKNRVLFLLISSVVIIITVVLIVIFHREIWSVFESVDSIRNWVDSWGILAPVLFVFLQIVQVVIFIIPGEIPQIAGGYLFGFFWGILLSTIGIGIGSTVNFYLARLWGLNFVEAILPHKTLLKMQKLISDSRSGLIYFIIFLIPGIPKDVIAYVAGLSKIRFWSFIIISSSGRLLGLILTVIIGVALADKNWFLAIVTVIFGLILVIVGIIYRERLFTLLKRLTEHPGE